MMKKYILLATFGIVGFFLGYGVIAHAWPLYGRSPHVGYFYGETDDYGESIFPNNSNTSGCSASGGNSIPDYVNSAGTFITFIICKLNSSNGDSTVRKQERTGAAFIIQTMIGSSRNKPPSPAEISTWEADVNAQDSGGYATWNAAYGYTINSYYQGTASGPNPDDDAFYVNSGVAQSIVFRNTAAQIVYAIRRPCGNPIGSNISPLPSPNFKMQGSTTVSSSTVQPGDTVTFRHYLKNEGPTDTTPFNISWATYDSRSGARVDGGWTGAYTVGQQLEVNSENYVVPAGTPSGTFICRQVAWSPDTQFGGVARGAEACTQVGQATYGLIPSVGVSSTLAEVGDTLTFTYQVTNRGPDSVPNPSCTPAGKINCPTPFPATTVSSTENYTVTAADRDTTVCRSLTVSPTSASGGSQTVSACTRIVTKPFFDVRGGDVTAGNDFKDSSGLCVANNGAQIFSWNSGSPSYLAAGGQFAVMAMNRITNFASAQSIAGVSPPTGLSFANTSTNVAAGFYGGNFGSASCMNDYYSQLPSGASTFTSGPITVGSGTYFASGITTMNGGTIGVGTKIRIYVSGDLYINDNVTYQNGFTVGTMPVFEVIVKGNIYIQHNVTQLDGIYIAQPNGALGGGVYTCASGFGLPSLNAISATCNTKLTVNGSLTGKSLNLGRSYGTLSQKVSAEDINYGPAFWIPQPATSDVRSYDSITSLSPVL